MKITELKCAACGGSLKIDEKNPNIAECEYCHTRFTLETEKGMEAPQLKRIDYTPVEIPKSKENGWEPYGWKRGVAMTVAFGVILLIWHGPELYERFKMNQAAAEAAGKTTAGSQAGTKGSSGAAKESASAKPAAKTAKEAALEELQAGGLMTDFCTVVFEKPVDSLTDAELSRIVWLEFGSGMDVWRIGYGFEDPISNPEAELTWLEFPRDDYRGPELSCLPAFSNLTFVGANQSLSKEDLSGLSITGLRGYFSSLEEIAALVEDPSKIKWASLTNDPISLKGLEKFPNLETLVIDGTLSDEKQLVQAASLKALELDMYDETMDFSTLGMMPWLESVSIRSKNLRDIGFVSKMSALQSLSLEYGEFLSLEPVKDLSGLLELSVVSCDELKDMGAAASLTGLKKLTLDLPYGCPEPDLSGLTAVEELYLEGFKKLKFLQNMGSLTTLTLDSCPVDEPGNLSGLANLKSLTCTTFGAMEQDYSFIPKLTALESVDLHGTATYGDISGIFNLPAVKRINISGMQCEINFDKIAENSVLEELSADHMKLYKNVNVSGGGGIVYVNWDDVNFVENLSFLSKLKGLKRLSLKENELTNLDFATSLESLQAIDFSDNYVTDVSPLSGLRALKQVNGTDNPVSNYDVLGKSVLVFK
ncbi:MAG: leucine-rich repeat domain-containing protein [Lachnospiraceae bacterium]|nr:leucine-rich repeat domain-containing protein [Lachnospiraceae bacterium]